MMRISVDFENCAELWWDTMAIAWEKGSRPQIDQEAISLIEKLLIGKCSHAWHDSIYLTNTTASAFQKWCQQFEGWEDGPDYAPTALTFEDSTLDTENLCDNNPEDCQDEQYYQWCSTEFGVHSEVAREVLE